MNNTRLIHIVFLALFLLSNTIFAQDWEGAFWTSGPNQDGFDLATAHDGNIMVLGRWYFTDGITMIKLDEFGDTLLTRRFGDLNEFAKTIAATSDNGFVMGGLLIVPGTPDDSLAVWKTDSVGNLLWRFTHEVTGIGLGYKDAFETSSGHYILVGEQYENNQVYGRITCLDASGNLLWTYRDGVSSNFDCATEIYNGYIVGGSRQLSGFPFDVLLKFDNNGNLVDSLQTSASLRMNCYGIVTVNDSFFACKNGYLDTISSITLYDGNMDEQWSKSSQFQQFTTFTDIDITPYGSYIASGWVQDSVFSAKKDAIFAKFNGNGDLIEVKIFGGAEDDDADRILSHKGAAYLVGGTKSFGFAGDNDIYVIKVDSIDQDFSNKITGRIYSDRNGNCQLDSGENIVPFSGIEYDYNGDTFYTSTLSNGYYQIFLDTGTYALRPFSNLSAYDVSACNGCLCGGFGDYFNIDTINIALEPQYLCPQMEVDIATSFIRYCTANTYAVTYCNNGTVTADSAYIQIHFDSQLMVDSASLPWSSDSGNTYTFQLGQVDVFECNDFYVYTSNDCDSTYIGQVLCAEAQIFPDTICAVDSTWNMAQLKATAECISNDTVLFRVQNIGIGNMDEPTEIIAIEDIIMIINDTVTLDAGTTMSWMLPADGSTYRIIAIQPQGYPLSTFTTNAVGFCGATLPAVPGPLFDMAFLAYPNDESSPFMAVDCQPVIGAYDPNDKIVFPEGASTEHFIANTTELEYKIRFQNTGNDTAFKVILLDTISPALDIRSIRPGASSHPYTMEILKNGELQFSFDPIILPDSNVNEPASHGFVQFKIAQNTDNEVGLRIENSADIYFDFNPPILTNTVFNTIGGIFLDTMIYTPPLYLNQVPTLQVGVYPNPSSDVMQFDLGRVIPAVTLDIYSIQGLKVKSGSYGDTDKFLLHKKELPNGTYLFDLYSNGIRLASGRLVYF